MHAIPLLFYILNILHGLGPISSSSIVSFYHLPARFTLFFTRLDYARFRQR